MTIVVHSAAMPTASAAVLDALNSLLESEQNSIFRFMDEGSPYLSRATVEVRRSLQEMAKASEWHAEQLYRLIDRLGGTPRPRGLQPEEQFLAYLSLKFLLPKLVTEKELMIRRFENAMRAIRAVPDTPPEVLRLLQAQQADHRAQLEVLKRATAEVLAAKTAT